MHMHTMVRLVELLGVAIMVETDYKSAKRGPFAWPKHLVIWFWYFYQGTFSRLRNFSFAVLIWTILWASDSWERGGVGNTITGCKQSFWWWDIGKSNWNLRLNLPGNWQQSMTWEAGVYLSFWFHESEIDHMFTSFMVSKILSMSHTVSNFCLLVGSMRNIANVEGQLPVIGHPAWQGWFSTGNQPQGRVSPLLR